MQPSPSPSIGEVLEVIRPHVEKVEEGFKAIRVTLDALAQELARGGGGSRAAEPRAEPAVAPVSAPEPVPPPAPAEPPRSVAVARPEPPRAVAVERPRPAPQVARPARAEAVAAAPAGRPGSIPISGGGAGNLSQIVFGEQLGTVPGVSGLSGSLLSDIYAGSPDALGLVGQLLCFRAANAERKPRFLKDIGEAFYRWNPQAEPAAREALIAWVHALLDADGLPNRIDIVQVGDRYDMQRHNTTDRGVEVADVFGWVVLRDNGGKVFSKANVSLR